MNPKLLLVLIFLILMINTFPQSSNDVVMLSDQCAYLGQKVYIRPGVYRAYQLGIGNDRLSSFHLPPGMAIQLFEDDNYRGRTETYYSSVSCLSASWNNRTSSIRIYWVHDPGNENGNGSGNNLPPQGSNVIFYKDNNYAGMAKEVGAGNFGSGVLGFLTDNISSIYIPPAHSVRVVDKSGRTQTFTSSNANLNYMYGWDNRINSGFIDPNYNGGGSGGNLPPQGNRVIFYGDMKYSGMSRAIAIGNFSPDALGFLKENISSIYIPPGHFVKVYDSRGSNQTFTVSISDLTLYGWNDKITAGVISGSSGGTLPPQGDRVIFYRDTKYSGMAKEFNQGNFGTGNLGFLTNNISSVYIPYGWYVRVINQNGQTQTFTASISNLAQYGWDNKIYSGFISNTSGGQQGGNQPVTVNLFLDANYQGHRITFGEGQFNNLGFGGDNNISSIQLPPGFAIIVYDGQNYTGQSRTFTGSVTNLAQYGWNDRISSVYIFRQ